MTSIPILDGDWEILLDDEKNQNGGSNAVAGMRCVQKAVSSPTIVTTRTLYSAVADAMDDFIAMGFRNAMTPTTPNAYVMENKYFIPRSSTEFLKEGAITANWALSASPDGNGNGVIKVAYTGGTAFVAGDIGRQVTQADSGDTGTLLDFDQDPDGTTVAWIRPDDSTPTTGDIFDGTGSLSVTGDGGTGASTSSTAGVHGETIWSAIQAIGAVPTATEVYIYQNRVKLPSSDGTFQWWATDPNVSLGIISILIQIKNSGVLIADGDVEVFARRYTALYDNFRLNVAGGGFSALPLASAPDINNTTGYWHSGTLTGVTGTPTVGNGIYVGASWAAATAKGVITEVNGSTDFAFYLIGDLSAISSTTAVTGYDFDTAANDGFSATTGTVAANDGGPTDTDSGEGGTVTISIGGFSADYDNDGSQEPYSIQIDAQSNVPIAKVYERLKYITRRGASETDLFGAGVNVPGESYRGLDGIFEYDANGGTNLTEGDDVNNDNGALADWTARLIHQNTTWGAGTYITVTDQQTSVRSLDDNDIVYDETGGTHTVTLHSGGTVGFDTFTSPKSSPFGTFTGTQIFGARGVYFVNPGSGDSQAYILTDDLGNLRTPPNTVSFTVTNTAQYDRVLVARDTGVDGIIDKDQFGGMDTPSGTYNGIGDAEIRAAGSVDSEVPQAGWVRVVENTKRQEHRYVYTSRTTGSNGVFTLKAITNGSATSTDTTGPQYTLTDTGASFQTEGVEPGMLLRNATTGEYFEVVSVTDENNVVTVEIFGTGGSGWTSTDTYTINKLIQDYTTSDDLYDLIIDTEATTTSVVNTFIKTPAANFDVVVNVRQGKVILPFTLNQAVGDGNTTVTVVRQPDTIAV